MQVEKVLTFISWSLRDRYDRAEKALYADSSCTCCGPCESAVSHQYMYSLEGRPILLIVNLLLFLLSHLV